MIQPTNDSWAEIILLTMCEFRVRRLLVLVVHVQ
jgi:hypothetical protein